MDKLRVSKVEGVLFQRGSDCQKGNLHLTQHHLLFRRSGSEEEQWIPYALLSLVTRQASLLPLSGRPPPSPQTPSNSSASFASSSRSGRIYPIQLRFRTFDAASLGFDSESKATDVFESLKAVAVIPTPEQVYAFYYTPRPALDYTTGWSIYSFKEEFTRQGVGTRSKAWRFSDINAKYELSPTYPALLAVPSRISDATLQYAAKYRSKGRIPALTYLHWANGGSITRCAQPLPGLKQARSVQDEKVVEAIFSSHTFADTQNGSPSSSIGAVYGATTTNLIVDARPTTNAVATYARGGGTENMDHYKGCRKAYMGIENIHVMRDSINRIVDALRAADEPTTFGMEVGVETDGIDMAGSTNDPSKTRRSPPARQPLDLQALKRSNWLRHLAGLLEGAAMITRNVHIASSHAMIHCSDGWDRTSQLAALAEICLDPYYRTLKGFAVLVEKDWLSFGHRFADRCGHGGSEKFYVTAADHADSSEEEEGGDTEGVVNASLAASGGGGGAQAAANAFWGFTKQLTSNFGGGGGHAHGNIKETSPVFTQFLDCVWQIRRQYPDRFEFNNEWLTVLHRELYECRFGTFLANSERERKMPTEVGGKSVAERTHSVWDFMLDDTNRRRFLNPTFDSSLDDPKRNDADMGVLLIKSSDVRWWSGVFGESIEEANTALDFEEAERIRRKAEKARWEEERQREKERRETEEKRLLEEQEALEKAAMRNSSNSGGTRGAVDLMTASQLQTGNGAIDPSRLAYKPRASPTPSGRNPSAHAKPIVGTHNQQQQQQQLSNDTATRLKSWAIGGWDRFQEAMSVGSTDDGTSSALQSWPSASSSSSRTQPFGACDAATTDDRDQPWASANNSDNPLGSASQGTKEGPATVSHGAARLSKTSASNQKYATLAHNPWRDDESTATVDQSREQSRDRRIGHPVDGLADGLPNGLGDRLGSLQVGEGAWRDKEGGSGGDGSVGHGEVGVSRQEQQQQQQKVSSSEAIDPLGVGL